MNVFLNLPFVLDFLNTQGYVLIGNSIHLQKKYGLIRSLEFPTYSISWQQTPIEAYIYEVQKYHFNHKIPRLATNLLYIKWHIISL